MVIFLSVLSAWLYVFAVITIKIIDNDNNGLVAIMFYPFITPLFMAVALTADAWQWFWNCIDERYGEIERIR